MRKPRATIHVSEAVHEALKAEARERGMLVWKLAERRLIGEPLETLGTTKMKPKPKKRGHRHE